MSSQPTQDQAPSTSTNTAASAPESSLDATYSSLRSYNFDADSEYLSGLASILGHPETRPTSEELNANPDLILKVRCFYFARKHDLPPIDPEAYAQWVTKQDTETSGAQVGPATVSNRGPDPVVASTASISTTDQPVAASSTTAPPEPPYPSSFAAIVDLITQNKPVPGIETIPDTVLDHGSSRVDHTARRKKPWESDKSASGPTALSAELFTSTADGEPGASADADVNTETIPTEQEQDVNGHLTTGEGVVKILQPNAIPDSGLLAKD